MAPCDKDVVILHVDEDAREIHMHMSYRARQHFQAFGEIHRCDYPDGVYNPHLVLTVNDVLNFKQILNIARKYGKQEETAKREPVKLPKPEMECEVAIDVAIKSQSYVLFYASPEAAKAFEEFGIVDHSKGTRYSLKLDKRFDFDKVVAYMVQYKSSMKPKMGWPPAYIDIHGDIHMSRHHQIDGLPVRSITFDEFVGNVPQRRWWQR